MFCCSFPLQAAELRPTGLASGCKPACCRAGQTFYEAPNGVHRVSANANQAEHAKLIAFFVCEHQTPITVAVPEVKNR